MAFPFWWIAKHKGPFCWVYYKNYISWCHGLKQRWPKSHIICLWERVYSLRAGLLHFKVHCIGREWKLCWFSVHIQIEVCWTSGAPSTSSGFRIRGKTEHRETKLWFSGPENICLDKREEYSSLCPDTNPMRMFAQANLTLIKSHSVESQWGLREPKASDLSALALSSVQRTSPFFVFCEQKCLI